MSDIQALLDRLTTRVGAVTITQYSGGFVDAELFGSNGVWFVTDRYTHESVESALQDLMSQADELAKTARAFRAGTKSIASGLVIDDD